MKSHVYLHIATHTDADRALSIGVPNLRWMLGAAAAMHAPQAFADRIGRGHPFAIDPQTVRLSPEFGWSIAGDQKLKPSYRRLFEMYLRDLDVPSSQVNWVPVTSAERRTYTRNVLEFVDRHLERRRNSDLELFDIETLPTAAPHLRPERFLTPYGLIARPEDLIAQLALWTEAPRTYRGRPVDFVLAIHPRLLGHVSGVRGLARAVQGRRVWLSIPEFRRTIRARRGYVAATAASRLIRELSSEASLGLMAAGFEICTLAGRSASAITFGLHLADQRLKKHRGGGPLPVGYVPAVHDWIGFRDVAEAIRSLDGPRGLAEVFCDDPACVQLYLAEGPARFIRQMFGTRATADGLVALPGSTRLQLDHGLRARLREIEVVTRVQPNELVRSLEASVRRSPFTRAARHLEAWTHILRATQKLAA